MPKITYHTCPTCKGRGEIEADLAQYDASPKHTRPDGTHIYGCHACLGECFIVHREPTSRELRGEEEPEQLVVSPGMPNIIPNVNPFSQPVGGQGLGGLTIGGGSMPPLKIGPNDITWTNGTMGGTASNNEQLLNDSIRRILNDNSLLNTVGIRYSAKE